MHQAPGQPMHQAPGQPMHQAPGQPMHQAPSQPMHQTSGQPMHQAPSQPMHQPSSPPPSKAPRGSSPVGHYEARPVHVWVAAVSQRVWEAGRCTMAFGHERCEPAHVRTVVTPGHFETQSQWVWVSRERGPELAVRGPVGGHFAVPVTAPRHGS